MKKPLLLFFTLVVMLLTAPFAGLRARTQGPTSPGLEGTAAAAGFWTRGRASSGLVANLSPRRVGTVFESYLDLPVGNDVITDGTLMPLQSLLKTLGVEVPEIVLGYPDNPSALEDVGAGLPVLGSFETLKDLLAKIPTRYGILDDRALRAGVTMEAKAAPAMATGAAPPGAKAPAPAPVQAKTEPSAGYSRTNVQVQGVDEADIVKTDGTYIYQVNNRRVVVARAYPPEDMTIVSILRFGDPQPSQGQEVSGSPKYPVPAPGYTFQPRELYVDDRYLVVIGTDYHIIPVVPEEPAGGGKGTGQSGTGIQPNGQSRTSVQPTPVAPPAIGKGAVVPVRPTIYPPVPLRGTVRAIIYDVTDKGNIKKLREVELEGGYVSSRKIGSALYLIANKFLDVYRILQGDQTGAMPFYRDSANASSTGKALGQDDFIKVPYGEIRYFPGSVEPNYIVVAGLNLDRPAEAVKVSTYLGAGRNVYASLQNLYVAAPYYEAPRETPASRPPSAPRFRAPVPLVAPDTVVYKFGMSQGQVTYKSKGIVPGTILNQFSMDEYDGYFRIATTKGNPWSQGEDTSKNNIYLLDESLQVKGKLENIAPGERIYSVRFMGNRGYLVTFKTVDPLFVVDLKDPTAPKVLGALKIPGYSDYLHPYDENHLIGFGKDTIELPMKDAQGNVVRTMAFYQGMKMALFDVTDVQNPIEKFNEIIGDRGTDSELLRNHKALLFDREKNLLAFPVMVLEVKDKPAPPTGGTSAGPAPAMPQYGQFTFQGAYVYSLDLAHGFTLKGKITHLTKEDYLKAGQYWYNAGKNVERILYIGDTLYTLSQSLIKANRWDDLQEQNSLVIP